MESLYKNMNDAVIAGEDELVAELAQKALDDGADALDILHKGLLPAMDVVAVEFRDGKMFVPEVLMTAAAMQAGNDVLKPHLIQADVPTYGKVVIGTVKGDLHDIGKKIVAMMLESSGFEVIDVGIDVSDEKFVEALKETGAGILAMSALLTTTMPSFEEVIKAVKEEGLDVKFMIGGAPVTEAHARKIGAEYSYDAGSAVQKAKELVK
jgi:5-methyltetrahydrofolate--homocysteine methyltransferase